MLLDEVGKTKHVNKQHESVIVTHVAILAQQAIFEMALKTEYS